MRKNKNRLMKILLYCLVVCGIIIISLRLYTIYTICISPDSFFEPNLPREELILVTGKSMSNVLMSVELTSDKAAALLEAIVGLLAEIIQIVILALALRIFQRNSIHRPFQVNMINWLQGFAILHCILPIVQGLFIICVLGLNQVNLYPRLILFQFLDIGLQVLPGLAIIGIAKVFRYGYSLQNEVDQIL